MRYYRLLAVTFCSVIFFGAPVWAEEDTGAVLGRLADIEVRMERYEEMLNAGQAPATEAQTNQSTIDLRNIIEKLHELTQRLQALEERMEKRAAEKKVPEERVQGKLQGLDLGAAQMAANSETGALDSDVEAILTDLEQKATKDKAPTSASASVPTSTLSTNDFESQYNESLGLLKKKKYKEAIVSLKYCLEAFPDDKKQDRVLYQLGKAHYGNGDYTQAKKSYAKSYRKNPKGSQAPYALFGLAQVFIKENNMKKACATLTEIGKRYPELDEQLKKDVAAAKSNSCGG